MRHLVVLALVAQHVIADGAGLADIVAHVVVGGANQVAGVAFLDELGHGARGHEGDVIGMGLDRGQHFPAVRRARHGPLDEHAGGRLRQSEPLYGRAGQHRGEKIAPLHGGILTRRRRGKAEVIAVRQTGDRARAVRRLGKDFF